MNATSTPICSSNTKKRELTSPEDLNELKKNKLLSESGSDTSSDISNLSIMADTVEPAATSEQSPLSQITLKENDLKTIADILRNTFEPQITAMISSIVKGVLDGLTSHVKAVEKENESLRTRVAFLEAKSDAAEQYSRRNCLRIAGVPENATENTDTYVVELARAIEADVSIDDIERSHRVGKPRSFGRPRDMIVKFVSYRVRRRVYGARTKTKDKGYRGVYINEDLTKPRSRLLLKARKMVKLGQLASAWSSDGTILVRDLRDTKHRIASDSDLAVFGPVPDIADQANNQAGSGSLELPSPNVTEMTL